MMILSCPLAPASLFPNIRQLTWHADASVSAAVFLRMVFVPSLLSLDLRVSSVSPAFLWVFSSLGTLCPLLQDMTLKYHPVTDELSLEDLPFITQPISQLHHLRTLQVPDIGIQGIQHVMLLRAPSLQRVILNFRTFSSSAWDKHSPSQLPGFQNLDSFGLHNISFERLLNFLNSLTILRTRIIWVFFTSQVVQSPAHVTTMLSQFFAILQERCDNNKLECFNLTSFSGKSPIGSRAFVSLRAFRNLTFLDIQKGCDISISDKELCYLTEAWPNLQLLRLSYYVAVDSDTTAVPTFHGLINLIRLCPVLSSLALVIDTTKLYDIDFRSPSGEIFSKHFTDLTLGNSVISSPLNVALILNSLYPHLRRLKLECWNRSSMESLPQKKFAMEQWELVNSYLHGFRL